MKDEQNWRTGDVAEAIEDLVVTGTGHIAIHKGSRFIVAKVMMCNCRRGCCPGVGIVLIGMTHMGAAQADCFRKIVPTFKEPCREGRAPIAPRKRTLAENAASYVRRLLDA